MQFLTKTEKDVWSDLETEQKPEFFKYHLGLKFYACFIHECFKAYLKLKRQTT